MNSKVFISVFSSSILIIMGLFFLLNKSYEKSIKAKYYYEIGDYKKSYQLSKEAFGEDIYNRMASTIMAQSKTSLKYVAFIDEAQSYMKEINKIATNDIISDADKAKIRLMCEIITKSYVKLAPSVITNDDLTKQSAKYNTMFEKLLEKVNR